MIIRITNFCLLCLLLLAAVPLGAQGWDRTYTQFFPREEQATTMRRIQVLPDGTFIGITSSISDKHETPFTIIHLDAMGSQIRRADFNFGAGPCHGRDIVPASGGGWIVLFQQGLYSDITMYLMKLDDNFNIIWRQALPEGFYVLSGCVANEANILVYGSQLNANDSNDQVLLRYENNGQLLDVQKWGTGESAGHRIRTLNSGSVITLGANYEAPSPFSLTPDFRRFSNQGVLLQSSNFSSGKVFSDFAVTPDQHLLTFGRDSLDNSFICKTDTNFNIIWLKYYPNRRGFYEIAPLLDGSGFWILEFMYSPPLIGINIRKMDNDGNEGIYKTVSKLGLSMSSNDMYALPDGGAIDAGAIEDNQGFGAPRLIRVDGNGDTYTAGISGRVREDSNNNCLPDENKALTGWEIIATAQNGDVFTTSSDTAGRYFLPLFEGAYSVTIRPAFAGGWINCADTLTTNVVANDTLEQVNFLSHFAPSALSSVCGIAYQDLDGDCQKDAFEPGYANWPVKIQFTNPATGAVVLIAETTSDVNGNFCLSDLSQLDNSLIGALNDPYSLSTTTETCFRECVQNLAFNFIDSNSVFIGIGLNCIAKPDCPVIEVDAFMNNIRPCIPGGYCVIHYKNIGIATADSASLLVRVDPALIVTGSNVPWSFRVNNEFTFELGALDGGQSGSITLFAQAPCNDPMGTTYCVEAHAYPDTLCQTGTELWDGSEIKVDAECLGDSVQFRIKNIGSGDMQQALEYIVIEDNVLLMSSPGTFQLSAGAEKRITLPATGAFYRLEAGQADGFPGLSDPTAWVEGCAANGSTISLGFVNQYELPDEEPWIDIFCAESVNSYDPNDKNGFPRGYGDEYKIEPNTDLEYVIRFQNTGTAPAINVEIRDTLPVAFLDPTTVRPGVSSHPYNFDIQGNGVLVFRFPLIMLPDSFSDLEGSQGFVKFRVKQQPNLPLGTKIRNDAAIYFDFNAPIITNKTLHTLARDFIVLKEVSAFKPAIDVNIMPNPTNGYTTVKVNGVEPETRLRFQLWSLSGRLLSDEPFYGAQYSLDTANLPEGLYLFSIKDENGKIASGKLVKYQP